MVDTVEAGRVLAREREVVLERRREEGEVRPRPGVLPHRLALGGRLDPRGGEVGGDAALAIPIAPRHRTTSRSTSPSSPSAAISSSHRPISSLVARSCARRCSAPSCCARAAAPAGGIIVR
jgi:hypothetical protein